MRDPRVRPYDKARNHLVRRSPRARAHLVAAGRKRRALCTGPRLARSGQRGADGNQVDAATGDGRHEKAAGTLRRAAGLCPLSIRQGDRETCQNGRAHRSGRCVGGSLAQAASQRPRPRRRPPQLERERAARGNQARRRHMEAAPEAMGTLLGRGPHFGSERPGRRRTLQDEARPEYIAAYGPIYR